MTDKATERVEYRVLLVDAGGAADIYEAAPNLPAAHRLLLQERDCWRGPRIQKRTVTESPWEDVSGDA